ncbi:hypothetical protein Tco_1129728 [Tanacetum coccineum]
MKILSVVSVKVDKRLGYGYLEEIVLRRADQKLYKLKEGGFLKLYLNNIEDMLLLQVQNKLFNLDGDDIVDLAVALPVGKKDHVELGRIGWWKKGGAILEKMKPSRYKAVKDRSKVRMGIMPTKTELALEQTQQGVSNEVLILAKVEVPHFSRVEFIATCSYSINNYKDMMKAQVHVTQDFRYSDTQRIL